MNLEINDNLIPGTVLDRKAMGNVTGKEFLKKIFYISDGIMLSQIKEISGIDGSTLQNWVKRGFLTKPQNKRYSLRQLCRLIHINLLKGILLLDRICGLLGYVNGQLDDESDDLIDDSVLYFMFVRLAARSKELYNPEIRESVLDEELRDYQEPVPGARDRVKEVLRIMLTAWLASRMAQEAERMLSQLQMNGE